MTKNNLSEHLSWLCVSEPSKPPPASSVSVIPDSSAADLPGHQLSDFFATQEGISEPEIDAIGTARTLSSHPETNHLESGPRFPVSDTIHTAHEVQTMARLQSGPKSATKSHLLSQNVPGQLPSPVATETGSARRPIRDVYNAQFRTQPLCEPPVHLFNAVEHPITDTADHSYSIQTKPGSARSSLCETTAVTVSFPEPCGGAVDKRCSCLDCGCCRSYRGG